LKNSLDRTVAYIECERPIGRGANTPLIELIDDVFAMKPFGVSRATIYRSLGLGKFAKTAIAKHE
jgi:hypothetical protein